MTTSISYTHEEVDRLLTKLSEARELQRKIVLDIKDLENSIKDAIIDLGMVDMLTVNYKLLNKTHK